MVKPWRVPEYHFQVSWAWGRMTCQEIIGLDAVKEEAKASEDSYAEYFASKMPGGNAPGTIVLKHITLTSNGGFRSWLSQFDAGLPQPTPATISLIFDDKDPSVIWSLSNAWPVRISPVSGTDDGAEVLIDSISVTHGGVFILKS